MVLGLGLEEK